MKKFLAFLLATLLLCSMLPFASATDEPSFVVSSASANPGEEVELTVSLANNPGIASFEYTVVYDETVLEWTGVTKENLPGTWDVKVGEAVTWLDADNHMENGVITTLKFKVKEGASAQTSEVTITYDPDDVFDQYEQNVTFAIVPGGVTITATEPEPTSYGTISGLGGVASDSLDLKFYVKDVTLEEGQTEPSFRIQLLDDNKAPVRTLEKVDDTGYATSNKAVYTVKWDSTNSRWVIRVKVFPKFLTYAFSVDLMDAAGENALPMKGYAYGNVGSSEVKTGHAYSFIDYVTIMKIGYPDMPRYATLYDVMCSYGALMKNW